MENIQKILADPLQPARRWKSAEGKKVIGHFMPDVPEEIVHAAGALPVAITGSRQSISLAQAHLPGYLCSLSRGLLDLGLKGELDFLDGIVIPYICDTTRSLFRIWHEALDHRIPGIMLRLPKKRSGQFPRAYLSREFERFAAEIQEIVGSRITEEDLNNSIHIYNENRSLLRKMRDTSIQRPEIISNTTRYRLIASSLFVPKEEHTAMLKRLLAEKVPSHIESSHTMPMIYIKGKVWEPPQIMEILDREGVVVAGDDLVTGSRYIAEDIRPDGDPFEALAERYFRLPPFHGFHYPDAEPGREFIKRVQESGAQGVIFLNQKFCEPAAFEYPDLKRLLDDRGIPSLLLETECWGMPLGQIETRIQAFVETIL